MVKIYTRQGDEGFSSLIGGHRLPKSHVRFHAYGTIDELNAHMGVLGVLLNSRFSTNSNSISSSNSVSSPSPNLFANLNSNPNANPNPNANAISNSDVNFLGVLIERLQNELFVIGGLLACEDVLWLAQLPRLNNEAILRLEGEIDRWTADLTPLKHFILPGGSQEAAAAHVARTVCRRAERWTFEVLTEAGPEFAEEYQRILRYLNRLSDHLFTMARWLNHRVQQKELIWKPE